MIYQYIRENLELHDIVKKKLKIRDSLVGTLSWNEWICLWDILNNDYVHIKHDLKENRYTVEDLIKIVDKANSIENIFNIMNILDLIL